MSEDNSLRSVTQVCFKDDQYIVQSNQAEIDEIFDKYHSWSTGKCIYTDISFTADVFAMRFEFDDVLAMFKRDGVLNITTKYCQIRVVLADGFEALVAEVYEKRRKRDRSPKRQFTSQSAQRDDI